MATLYMACSRAIARRMASGPVPLSVSSARHTLTIRGLTSSRRNRPNFGSSRVRNWRSYSLTVDRRRRVRASAIHDAQKLRDGQGAGSVA